MPAYRVILSLTAVALLTACTAADPGSLRTTRPPAGPSTATAPPDPYASLSQDDKDKRLITAARRGQTDDVTRLFAAGADTETRDSRQRTPLLLARRQGFVTIERILSRA